MDGLTGLALIAPDDGRIYRSHGEILHELVDTLNQVCHLLRRRANLKGSYRSIELRMAIRRIQRDAKYLEQGLGVTVEA